MLNQLFTAKGKYHLFFTFLREKKIYLFKTVSWSTLSLEALPSCQAPPVWPHLDHLDRGMDLLSPLLAGLTHHLKLKQTDEGQDCSRSRASGCCRFGRRCSFALHICALGAVILIKGGAWRDVRSFPAGRTCTLHMARVVHTRLEERKKNRELQMDLVSAKISTPKDSVIGEMPLNHRKVFF